MKIIAYDSIKYENITGEYEVLYNPSSYNKRYEIEYETKEGKSSNSETQKFGRIKPQIYEFEFLFDGTQISPSRKKGQVKVSEFVSKEIKTFLKVTGKLLGEAHRPPFLKVIWGDLLVTCVLQSADVSYTLFHPNGFPLRAKIKASFAEAQDEKLKTASERMASPDLTHMRTVKQGQTLPLLSKEVYGDAKYYMQIAKFNKLVNLRNLKPGTNIELPPLVTLITIK